MSTVNSLFWFRKNVQRLSTTLSMFSENDWAEDGRRLLKKLDHKLAALALQSSPKLEPRLEMEFYSIIESHPKIREASRSVFQEELVEICANALSRFADLEKQRPLTNGELKRLRKVRKDHQEAVDELGRLRQQIFPRRRLLIFPTDPEKVTRERADGEKDDAEKGEGTEKGSGKGGAEDGDTIH